ncbi:MAG: class I SAM-dependent RNA methyltransferase [Myxococcaceae bacterium]|nr:class I SAM-dependent RNA methyltransferase [Myxococcaceae bacterium]MBH2006668.1 class I SAM-dependent RNA methyltransferase [Myxococcaceae bacterium]
MNPSENHGIVDTVAFGGNGVVRESGKVVFVPFVLPGESVSYEIVRSKKSHAFARLREVLVPSFARVDPPCAYYERCGGCQLQHAAYSEQLRIKQRFVEDALQRIAQIECQVKPIIGTDRIWNYRNRMRWHYRGKEKGLIGVDGRTFVPIRSCAIDSGKASEVEQDVFIQAHPEQSSRLYADILERVNQLKLSRVLDLYCGIGILTQKLAQSGHAVTALELNSKAIEIAKRQDRQSLVRWICADVQEVLEDCLRESKPEVVLVNPPRTGLTQEVVRLLAQHRPKYLFYTSCMPPTLARDLKDLLDAGYRIDSCQPYDLFPQTTHVETVVQLSANTLPSHSKQNAKIDEEHG